MDGTHMGQDLTGPHVVQEVTVDTAPVPPYDIAAFRLVRGTLPSVDRIEPDSLAAVDDLHSHEGGRSSEPTAYLHDSPAVGDAPDCMEIDILEIEPAGDVPVKVFHRLRR